MEWMSSSVPLMAVGQLFTRLVIHRRTLPADLGGNRALQSARRIKGGFAFVLSSIDADPALGFCTGYVGFGHYLINRPSR